MYGVKIITENGEVALDMTEPSFPYTFESASVAELQDQSASWSYTIQIPRTPLNERVFDEVGEPFARTDTPYRRVMCNVYADGIRIIHNGVMFIDRVTEREYEVQILSDNADVFELLQAIEFKSWEERTITKLPFTTITPTTPTDSQMHVYFSRMAVSYDAGLGNTSKLDNLYYYAIPAVRIGSYKESESQQKSMLNHILHSIGYSLETDTPAELLDNLYMTLSSRRKDDEEKNEIYESLPASFLSNIATSINEFPVQFSKGKYVIRMKYSAKDDSYVKAGIYPYYYADGTPLTSYEAVYNYLAHGTAQIQNSIRFEVWNSADVKIASRVLTFADIDVFDKETGLCTIDLDIDTTKLTQDKKMKVAIFAYGDFYTQKPEGGATRQYTGYFREKTSTYQYVLLLEEKNAVSGQEICLEANLPFTTALDFFKFLAQTFGWIVNVDAEKKIIKAYSFATIKNLRTFALDWTSKVIQNEDKELEYQFGEYAQNNIITYGENEARNQTEENIFTIPNVNLLNRAELLELPIASGWENVAENWERNEKGEFEYNSTGMHLIWYGHGITGIDHYHVEQVLKNYQPLIDTLQRVEVLNVKMLLTAIDIIYFNPYVPIYLRQYGAYYYVNKISEWEEGKPCEVELLRL